MQPYQPGYAAVRPTVDARALWSGGLAAALVAALVAVVGVVIARGIFDIPVLAPKRSGTFGDASTGGLALAAAIGALLATALIHLLLLYTPRPFAAQIATGIINLFIGIAIGSLVSSVAVRSLRRRPRPGLANPGMAGP